MQKRCSIIWAGCDILQMQSVGCRYSQWNVLFKIYWPKDLWIYLWSGALQHKTLKQAQRYPLWADLKDFCWKQETYPHKHSVFINPNNVYLSAQTRCIYLPKPCVFIHPNTVYWSTKHCVFIYPNTVYYFQWISLALLKNLLYQGISSASRGSENTYTFHSKSCETNGPKLDFC